MRRSHRPLPQLTPSEVERFWQNVDRSGGLDACWLYGLTATLHPLVHYRIHTVRGQTYAAHRVAYTLVKGPIPDGLEIDHTCDVKACVNPAHLEPVSHRENIVRGYERRRTWEIYVNWEWDTGHYPSVLSRDIGRLIEEGAVRIRFWHGQRFLSRADLEAWKAAREHDAGQLGEEKD